MRWTRSEKSYHILLRKYEWHHLTKEKSAQIKPNMSKYKLKVLSKLENLEAPRMDDG